MTSPNFTLSVQQLAEVTALTSLSWFQFDKNDRDSKLLPEGKGRFLPAELASFLDFQGSNKYVPNPNHHKS